ncbi:MAG: hypothetical protein WBC21_01165 [Minisyncoccales bacterium]
MKKQLKDKNCIYCGKPAEDEDHIPSRNLYKGIIKNINPIKVPSCRNCNNSFSKDEVYFRDLISSLRYEQSITATCLFDSVIKRSIIKKPGLAKKMFNQMSLVNFYSKGGIYLGRKTAIKIDHKRVFNVLDKYIKGLFYHHFGQAILNDWIISHHWLTPQFEKRVIDILKKLKWKRVQKNVFVYGYNFVPNTYQSIWCLVFFGQPIFYSLVLDNETANKNRNQFNNQNKK